MPRRGGQTVAKRTNWCPQHRDKEPPQGLALHPAAKCLRTRRPMQQERLRNGSERRGCTEGRRERRRKRISLVPAG
eukprot:scaffold29_cov251-Pinguiococcus_pyrenoidosus.AAC.13